MYDVSVANFLTSQFFPGLFGFQPFYLIINYLPINSVTLFLFSVTAFVWASSLSSREAFSRHLMEYCSDSSRISCWISSRSSLKIKWETLVITPETKNQESLKDSTLSSYLRHLLLPNFVSHVYFIPTFFVIQVRTRAAVARIPRRSANTSWLWRQGTCFSLSAAPLRALFAWHPKL